MSEFIASIGVVAYNEEKNLHILFDDILNQSYKLNNIELLLVDSMSTDNTKKLMEEFKKENEAKFYSIRILENEKKIQATGWNIVLDNFSGDSISRIDAHSRIDKDFIKNAVSIIEEGEYVVGGPRDCIINPETPWTNTLLQAENSMFGSSISKSRRDTNEKIYVKSFFHATYKREVIEKCGRFNVNLLRTEDNEFHYRIRQNGYKFCFSPLIKSSQFARMSLKKMTKQKYGNGYWIGKTIKYCPGCISIFHLVPFAFLMAIIAFLIPLIWGLWYFIAGLGALYFLFGIYSAVISGIKNGFTRYQILIPFMFLILHLSYGFGTLFGLLSINRFKKS